MIITQVYLVLGKKATLKCTVLSHNTMQQMSNVLREYAIGKLTAGMPTRVASRSFYVNFSTINRLQRHFRKFGWISNQPHNRRPCVCCRVGERFAPWGCWGYGMGRQGYVHNGSWKCPSSSMACILTWHVTHWACLECWNSLLKFKSLTIQTTYWYLYMVSCNYVG